MIDSKVRVLGIAPYEGMKSIMLKLAGTRDDIELSVYVGDLYKGAEIAQQNFQENYDVIISRGGTAELIGKVTQIPVIEITLSVYDILRAIKLAENFSARYAIVGFPGITSSAHLLCDLLQYKIDIFTIHNLDEVQITLKGLKKKGYKMVLCDMIANTTAKQLGLNAILITSGTESINSAFDQAVKLCRSYANIREENKFLRNVIRGQSNQTVVFDNEGNLYFSTLSQEAGEEAIRLLKKEIPDALACETHRIFKNIGGTLYSVTSKKMFCGRKEFVVFYFTASKIPLSSGKYGILYSGKKDVEDRFFNSFYSVTGAIGELSNTIEQMTQSQFPIMITGEEGTGKEQVAGAVYSQSQLKDNPLVTINCSLINDKSWTFLTNHYKSPFNDNNNTIYLKNIDALSESRRKQLLSIIVDMNLCRRNRMMFSCVCKREAPIPESCMEFVNLLSCLTLHLAPLKDQPDQIPVLANLYLSTLNVNLAKEILGLEPAATELLQQFDWPGNYTQFKRILNELAVITTTAYIAASSVSMLLEKEKTAAYTTAGSSQPLPFDLDRTLDEINHDIIHIILNETGGNQSAAAKKLGISRTTLWRLLKE